jgi:hypothetical protein
MAIGGVSAGALVLLDNTNAMAWLRPLAAPPGTTPTLTLQLDLRRREDMLGLHFAFWNLVVDDTTDPANPVLTRLYDQLDAYVVVGFGALSLGEQTFVEGDPGPPPTPGEPLGAPPVGSRLAGFPSSSANQMASRLAFAVPANTTIPYTTDGLLDWLPWTQRVVPVALPPVPSAPHVPPLLRAPAANETALQIPWLIDLSPNVTAAWAHSSVEVSHPAVFGSGSWTELWHTRLATVGIEQLPSARRRLLATVRPSILQGLRFVDETSTATRTVRAVWAEDPGFATQAKTLQNLSDAPDTVSNPFEMEMTPSQRSSIVYNSSAFANPQQKQRALSPVPNPIQVNRLMLSSLGAWLDSDGQWNNQVDEVTEWRHLATMGRDHYVRIVLKGYLFPFGHKASLVKVSERKFDVVGGQKIAYLRQRFYIVVRNPEVTYPGASPEPNGGRGFPLRSVRVTTVTTPNLAQPQCYIAEPSPPAPFINPEDCFVPNLVNGAAADGTGAGQQPFLFHMVGTDWAGNQIQFTSPVVFVGANLAFDLGEGTLRSPTMFSVIESNMAALCAKFDDPGQAALWTRPMGNQRTALAEVDQGDDGKTTHQVVSMTWGAQVPDVPYTDSPFLTSDRPYWFPTMASAAIRLSAAEQASGHPLPGGPPVVTFPDRYLQNGFQPGPSANTGEVYLALASSAALSFSSQSDKGGGVATPNLGITCLSRSIGPVAGSPDQVADNAFDPSTYFSDAKILGGIALANILSDLLTLATGGPAISYATQGTVLTTTLHWAPTVVEDPIPVFVPNDENGLTLDAVISTDVTDPSNSTYSVVGVLKNFEIHLFGTGAGEFLEFSFDRLQFTAKKGAKTKVDASITDTQFKGVLAFIQQLESLLSGNDGPAIDVTPTQVSATISLPIPSIGVGIFSLENISLNLGVILPFNGDPARVRFSFCTRDNPFILTVAMFGGGGFVGVALGLDGLELLEASLEFGASISIDLGVASGGVSVMAGIYFSLAQQPDGTDQATLTGFFKFDGQLEVLGIITLAVEVYLGFTYMPAPANKVSGQAKLSMEVSLGPFSTTVHASVEKHFGNSNSDPSFGDLMAPADWSDYCGAFAPTAVS